LTFWRSLFAKKSPVYQEIFAFLALAIPLAGVQLSQAAIGFVDTLMMGRIGLETLAAGGLAALTFSVFLYTSSGILMGVSPIISTAYGAGDKQQIERVVQQGCLLDRSSSADLGWYCQL
jgi:multidrug resistance protein, MATE family